SPVVVTPFRPIVVVLPAVDGSRRKATFLAPPFTVASTPMLMLPVNAPGAALPPPTMMQFVVEIELISACLTWGLADKSSIPKELLAVRGRRTVAPPFELIEAPRFPRLNVSAARTMFEVLAAAPLLIAAWLVMLSAVRLIAPLLVVMLPSILIAPLVT